VHAEHERARLLAAHVQSVAATGPGKPDAPNT
jgi:hypothetical protein